MKVEYDEMMMMMMTKKKKMKSNDTSICVIFDDEYMMVEILSRLPVKSLLRLKCVSKRWCSLIQDPYFVDLHSARSTTRPGATFLISRDLSGRNITFFGSTLYDGPHFHSIDYVNFISDAGGHDRFGPYYYLPPGGFTGHDKLTSTQILNGLLCMGFNQETVWILNPSTRKTILLTKTNIKEEENTEQTIKNRDGDHDEYNWMNKESFLVPKYAFGFDPVIKKYKVICICHVDIWHIPPQIFLYHPDDGDHDFHPQLLKTYYLCMVLTIDVDDNNCCWRRIDEIPPYPIHGGDGPVYLNGVLYWGDINSSSSSDIDDVNKVIVAFNLSSEKFSVIKIPDLILEHTRSPSRYRYRQQLYEVDGCLAILGNRNAAAGRPPNTIQIWKLVVLPPPSPPDDDVAACCWVKETILTLSFDWRRRGYLFEVIGTNQILLKRNNSRLADASLCYYDRDNNDDDAGNKTNKEKNKKTGEKLEFTGECASFTGILPCSGGILQIHRRIHTCTETLWSLNN